MITLANAPVPYGAFGLSRPDLVGIPSGADLRQLVQAAGQRVIDLGAYGLLETLSHRYGVARTGCFATVGERAVAIHDGRLAVDAAIIATTGDRVVDALAPAARRCEAPGGEAGSGHLYPATGSRLPRFGHRSRGNGGRPTQYAIRAGLAPVGDLRPRVRGSDGDQPWETPGRLQSGCRPPRPFYCPGFVKSLGHQRRADNQSCLRSRPTRATV